MRPPRLAALALLTMPFGAVDARAQSAAPIASLQWLTGCLEARSDAAIRVAYRRVPCPGAPSP